MVLDLDGWKFQTRLCWGPGHCASDPSGMLMCSYATSLILFQSFIFITDTISLVNQLVI